MQAQDKVPQYISYQGVARDNDGIPIANKDIVVEITILGDSEKGEIVWQETHQVKTNDLGVFSLLVGKGVPTSRGTTKIFSQIKWAKKDFFIRTRVDFGDQAFGNGLVDMGTVQLTSVPYSIVADTALHVRMNMEDIANALTTGIKPGQGLVFDGSKWVPGGFISIDGKTDLTGNWTISSNNIILSNGKLITANLQIGAGTSINSIKTTITGNGSDNSLVTEKAVVDYVKSIPGGYWTLSPQKLLYVSDVTYKVGIGTITPSDKFHVEVGSDGFLVTGKYESGGEGRMSFYPRLAALRAGFITAGNVGWNEANIGNFSTAFGKDNQASGDYSGAFGESNISRGNRSFTAGLGNDASGVGSTAFGNKNKPEAAYSFASGEANSTNYLATNSVAFGLQNSTYGEASLCIGSQNSSRGKFSVAVGLKTTTQNGADGSLAQGYYSSTYGIYSASFGVGTTAASYAEFAIGQYNTPRETSNKTSWTAADRIFVVGIGTSSAAASDGFVVLKNGYVGIKKSTPTQALDVSGSILYSGTSSNSSDIRFKKEITPMQNSLDKVLKMNSVYYFWKKDEFPERNFSDTKQIGLIAQEVEKIIPEVVLTNADGYKSVDYSKITVVLIEAIKEQQKMILELKNKNENAQTDLKTLNNKYNDLNKRFELIESILHSSAQK
jgi:chaperonin cofactor prefoldin